MSVTPAQVANDLDAQADFFRRRDDRVERACRDTAKAIRTMLAGEHMGSKACADIEARLIDAIDRHRHQPTSQIHKLMSRAVSTLQHMRSGAEG